MSDDDRTSKARLRDAALALVAEGGTLSARTVAERAGVTPGLIRHHFGSMAGLQRACDEHVARVVVEAKGEAIAAGGGVDVMAALRETGQQRLMGYLARRLGSGSPEIDELVDTLAEDAVGYLRQSIDAGLLRPVDDVVTLARMLTLYSLGSLVLHDHLERLLDVDVTSPDLATQPGVARYVAVQFEVFRGLFTDEFLSTIGPQLGKE